MLDNPYSILNITQNASSQEIKSAYRKLSMKLHPDRNGNCEQFQKLNSAYKFLISNKNTPSINFNIPSHNSNSSTFNNHSQHHSQEHLQNHSQQHSQNHSLNTINNYQQEHSQKLSSNPPDNQYKNVPYDINYNTPPPIVINLVIDFPKNFIGTSEPILVTRWVIENNVKRHETETIYVNIPKGTDDNEIFTIKNKGNVLAPNIIGDVKVFIKIKNDTLFFRQGLDIIYKKDISLKEALCGFSFQLNFIDGKNYQINNKSGNIVSPNYKKIINNMGFTRKDVLGNLIQGNLIIEFNIIFPKTLSVEQSKQLEMIL